MTNFKSLVSGVGSLNKTKKYYNDWSKDYDKTLKIWNYQAPKKSSQFLKKFNKVRAKNILDLACGTGLFGLELKKLYPKSIIYGSDISKESLKIAHTKNIYYDLKVKNFEQFNYQKIKFDLISLIGSMTYCKNFDKLFLNINNNIKKNGFFIFTHRVDLWEKQNFSNILKKLNSSLKIIKISRPINYLPLNKDFKNKIKIRIVLLQNY